jgi:hypothetical protein
MQALSQLSYSPGNSGETLREARKAVKKAAAERTKTYKLSG